jgi:NADP-dependent 3-hydroxy acid dehydrogenase YdfG
MILITGGSGEVAQQVALKLLEAKHLIQIYGRGDVNESPLLDHFEKVDNYNNLNIAQRADALLVTNGSFIFKNFEEMSESEIGQLISSNFDSVIKIIWQFLKKTNINAPRDIFVIGSTAAYDLGPGAAVYGACKLALKGLMQSLNKEYQQSDTRFSFISFSTVDNAMGRLVPDQVTSTLLNTQDVSAEIANRILRRKNYYEPEVILRRRFIQEHKK